MSSVVLYLVAALAAVLPLVFRSRVWVRALCLVALGFCASAHLLRLLVLHRLVVVESVAQLHLSPGEPPPAGLVAATDVVARLSHAELPFVALLFLAFALFAVFPLRQPSTPASVVPSPNNALQRTEAGGRVGSEFDA